MGNNSSRQSGTRGTSSSSHGTSTRPNAPAASGGRTTGNGAAASAGANAQQSGAVPQHLANQYSTNNARQRSSTGGQGGNGAAPAGGGAGAANTTGNAASNTQERGVQEGQMVKMLATIEATTVQYNSSTQLLTFFITSACPSLTYEIHTGVKEFVQKGKVSYMPNKPKMEPTRTLIEGTQENRKVTVKLDISKLDEKEKNYNKHYPKQMPCVIVVRYRTTELQKKEGGGESEEVIVEHSEHTAVDLAEKPKRRVISQIVTACGNAYIVENLYGADSDNPAGENGDVMVGSTIAPHDGEDDEDGLCVICLTNNKDTAVMPCRHMCMCKECGEQLLKHKPVCPVCRGPISTLLHMPSLTRK